MPTTLTPPNGFTPRALTSWNRYFIPQADTNIYRAGDAVHSAGGTDANGIIAVTLHLGTGPARGVIVAVDPGLPATGGLTNGQKLSIPAIKAKDYYVWVLDDPSAQFAMVDDGLTPANSVASSAGKYANFTVGASAAPNGGSTAAITSSTLGATSGCLQVLSLVPGSAYGAAATWLVKFAAHELANGGAGVGTGISTLAAASDYNSNLVTPLAGKLSNSLGWDGTTPNLQSGVSPVVPFGSNAFVYTGAGGAVLDGQTYATGDVALWGQGGTSTFTRVPSHDLTAAQIAAGATAGMVAVDSSGVPHLPDGTVLTTGAAGPAATTFATAWDMSSAAGKDMGEYTMTAAGLALTSVETSSVPGGFSDGIVIADGAHVPTVDGLAASPYTNTAGARNRATLRRVGKTKLWSWSAITGAIMAINSIPSVPTAPQILVCTVGAPLTFLPSTGISGYPAPTVTYDFYNGATLIQANVTSGVYTVPAGTGTAYLKVNATNSSGTTTLTSAGVTINQIALDPGFTLAGDSIPQYTHGAASMNNTWTIARDTNGLVTIVKAGHGLYGDQTVYLSGMTSDPTFNCMGQCHFHDTSTLYIQTAVTGLPVAASSTICATGQITTMGAIQSRYLWAHFNSANGGGLKFQGSFVQGGQFAGNMAGVGGMVDQAALAASYGVILTAGTNDNKGGTATATTITSIKALINIITGRGKKCYYTAITPLGAAFTGYSGWNQNAVIVNAAIQAYCDGVNSFFVDAWTPLYSGTAGDGGGQPAYSWATLDGVHWSQAASTLIGAALTSVASSHISAHSILPLSSGAAITAPFATKMRDLGVWAAPTSGAGFGAGQTNMAGLGLFATTAALQAANPAASNSGAYALVGTSTASTLYHSDGTSWSTNNVYTGGALNPANGIVWNGTPGGYGIQRGIFGTTGSATSVSATVNPGDGKSLGLLSLITSTSASDQVFVFPEGTPAVSLTTAGNFLTGAPVPGDKFKLVVELAWSNWVASNASSVRLHCQSNNSGTYLNANGGDDITTTSGGTIHSDSGTLIVETGVMVMAPSSYGDPEPTALSPEIEVRFAGASASPLALRVRNFQWVKITDATYA